MEPGWIFEPFVDNDGQLMLRLIVTDIEQTSATLVLRPADLAILARHVVVIDARSNEIERLSEDLLEAGIFTEEQRRLWVTKRVAALLTQVAVEPDGTISPAEARV